MRTSSPTDLSDWALPLRRRVDALMREGRFQEAGLLLSRIRRTLTEEPPGGRHENPTRREPIPPSLFPWSEE